MIIDGHAHACGVYLTESSIKQHLSKNGIDMVVLSGGEPGSNKNYAYPMFSNIFKSEKLIYFFNKIICTVTRFNNIAEHIDEQNEIVARLCEKSPDMIINTYWINPNDSNCLEKLKVNHSKYNFKMLKLHQCWTNFDINCASCNEIFSWAQENNMPVFIHFISHQQVVLFADMANYFSNTKFIVAHMIGADYLNNVLKYKNVYFDLSAPQLYSIDILKRAIRNFGVDRLVLGSDTPYGRNNINKVLSRLRKLSLSNQDIDLISGENLEKLLSLKN